MINNLKVYLKHKLHKKINSYIEMDKNQLDNLVNLSEVNKEFRNIELDGIKLKNLEEKSEEDYIDTLIGLSIVNSQFGSMNNFFQHIQQRKNSIASKIEVAAVTYSPELEVDSVTYNNPELGV